MSDLLVELSTEEQQLLAGGKEGKEGKYFKKGYFFLFPKGEDFYYKGKAEKVEIGERD
jgi:hypothetical protein